MKIVRTLGVFFEYRIIEENGQIRIKRLKAEDCVFFN